MSGPVEIVLIVAVIGYVLVRRLLGEPVEAKRMLVLPAVLVGIGFFTVLKEPQTAESIVFLVATTVLGVLLGVLRGASTRVFEKDGVVHLRYTAVTIVLWVANIAVKFAAGAVLAVVAPGAQQSTGNGMMLTLGAGLLAEGLAVLAKAVRTEGRIIWAKGRDGQPHRTSPGLDRVQENAARRGGLLKSLLDSSRVER
ncbi:DUF1453 domain-containing protein [Actinosynnema sp. ALI-1.44]|uniref:CcdC protein domain-containing protein n=1 Tax=Actinosynnema sp. ALI-1.44 TaxID=1933779 RepID=UPI00097C755E|nr:CcdC protein domain-containing protein [Actinosynnema sp. ALI-1.44]ONI83145.1 DUF1453 domain-containing protein [Actinosynnema sp. ALI-1.44]